MKVGPFELTFEPDGDDDGIGIVVLETDSGYRAETGNGVPVEEWVGFVAAVGSKDRRPAPSPRPRDPQAPRAAGAA